MAQRRDPVILEFEDKFGDKKVVHRSRNRGSILCIKRGASTPAMKLTRAVGKLVGAKIKITRLEKSMTGAELGRRAGLKGNPKEQIYSIEHAMDTGVRLGTLYVIAAALGVAPEKLLPTSEEAFALADVGQVTQVTID